MNWIREKEDNLEGEVNMSEKKFWERREICPKCGLPIYHPGENIPDGEGKIESCKCEEKEK